MFIQTEQTPNPKTLKFLCPDKITDKRTLNIISLKQAIKFSPLAENIFNIGNVEGVFIGEKFISVTKNNDVEWYDLKPRILGEIIEYLSSGKNIVTENIPKTDDKQSEKNDSAKDNDCDAVVKIKDLIETRVRPAVAGDGGDIIFHDFIDGIVYLEMHGACSGCPSAEVTLKMGIENMLKYYVPEVLEVREI